MSGGLFSLQGKTALITGSTRGIGRAVAQVMAEAGARVIVSSEDAGLCAQEARAIQEQGLLAEGITCDVTDMSALQALVDGTVEVCGGIDILLCNAGITGQAGSWALDDFDRVMAVNLRSIVGLTQLALPHIASRGGGSVILMSSLSGVRGNAAINAYALAKAGLAQLARNLAVQWGPSGVRVNAVSPGLIRTEFSGPLLSDTDFMARRMGMTPLRRPGEPHEIAGTCVYLASSAGAFTTGQNLVVDGGTAITDGS